MPNSTPPGAPAFTAVTRAGWKGPAGFRSLGDGQVDFKAMFSKLTQYDFAGWAVLEWECALKHIRKMA